MRILIDTSIWSLSFRRKESFLNKKEKSLLNKLIELINDSRVVLIGPVRQEILSGIPDENQFNNLKEKLRAFEDITIQIDDYELSAHYYNSCRKNGIQGSHIDFLICAVAYNNNFPIFTIDKDFTKFSKFCEIDLYR